LHATRHPLARSRPCCNRRIRPVGACRVRRGAAGTAGDAGAGAAAGDEEYTAQIRRFTTEPFFLTPLVDHLPASSTVPTPLQFNGYIAGAAEC
jgi:hypothetical protein